MNNLIKVEDTKLLWVNTWDNSWEKKPIRIKEMRIEKQDYSGYYKLIVICEKREVEIAWHKDINVLKRIIKTFEMISKEFEDIDRTWIAKITIG